MLRELQDRLDIRTVVGHAAYPEVLERAGANDADIIVALTDSDETNMVACQIAYTLYHTPTKIGRIRAAEYMSAKRLYAQDAIPVDVRISPEQLVCEHISSNSFSIPARCRFWSSPTGACAWSARAPTRTVHS